MRVFILGAGASSHAGYPLMKDLGLALCAWAALRPSPRPDVVAPALQLLDSWRGNQYLANLESAITKADEGLIAVPAWGQARAGIGILLAEYCGDRLPDKASAYAAFARVLEPGDVIITFNYDCALEIELVRAGKWHLHDGYGFFVGDQGPCSAVTVLKLHGSANWRGALFGGRTGFSQIEGTVLGERPTFSPGACRQLGLPNFADPQHVDGGMVQYLILPSFKKEFLWKASLGDEGRAFWTQHWEMARKAIARCQNLSMIGYSLPEADVASRNLLLNGRSPAPTVTICCGDDSGRIAKQFQEGGYTDVDVVKDNFEIWVSNHGIGP